ncbi:MAG: HipA domain-containing protein [Spirochaeta sp.]|nr:HipA domain-containing protein [Spirochaeta sp.]
MHDQLEVWVDSDIVPLRKIGSLSHDRGTVWFAYDQAWLTSPTAFQIDPRLQLLSGSAYAHPETGTFAIFLDSAPDRWGQTLMNRRELLAAKDDSRRPRILRLWDYLIGVQDQTRQGALRFKLPGTDRFIAHATLTVPPVTALAALSDVATDLTRTDHEDLSALRQWLSILVAPGSSLGGARPKANVIDDDGSLWIAKFPAHQDRRNVGAWEYLTWILARQAGITVPPAAIDRVGSSPYHTFRVRRFDRLGPTRRFYASALTLLDKNSGDEASYLELAEFISNHGDPSCLEDDLHQLFRRVAFNIAVGNRDDHLRNHGFILGKGGWQLAPAFDVNPDPDKDVHVLAIDDTDTRPDFATVRATAPYYRLSPAAADAIIADVTAAVRPWRDTARRLALSREEILQTSPAFQSK